MNSITEITVRNYHVDHFGHVNHARYVEFIEEARWQYLETNELLEPIHRIAAFHVVVKVVIDYLHAARMGDVLRIETRIGGRSNHSFQVDQKALINASGKVAIEATVTNVFVDNQGRAQGIDKEILGIWPDLSLIVPQR